ncbi:carotenoid oxygenase family protein [Mycolicibacterium sp. 120266]|uniref:carotenoid oxygenase family protein n=1 Tax=Mycolicibacterium sp. 120266 TaxID=3090601 RepID=UPI00299E368C|nr:carotenoid oxygenase family protein [Mycolicibacterium sp. 120266]MDX1873261.1 carotenoid oxygenase family protein [Mycolicibacterium sp. 120266]
MITPQNTLPTQVVPRPQGAQRHAADVDWNTTNMFLNGPFAPWHEETEAFDLPVVGKLPDDLAGALFRVVANPRFRPLDLDRYHWWEGDGGVAGCYIRDGKASLRMRWVMTETMKIEVEAGEAIYSGFVNGSSIHKPLPAGAPPAKNVANTNVGLFADHLLVYYEGGLPYSLNPENLQTYGEFDFSGGIDVLCTAHYKIDPHTGDMLFFAAVGNNLTWYQADVKTAKIVDAYTFDMGCPAMVHDYVTSEHHAIFLISPAQFRRDRIQQGRPGVLWDEGAVPTGSRFAVLDRRTHHLRWYDTGLMLAPTHFFNAYETQTGITVDLHVISRLGNPAEHPDDAVISHSWFPPAMAWRFRLDNITGQCTQEMLTGVAGEFPKINDAWAGRDNRYGYFVTTRALSPQTMSDGLARHDFATGQTIVIEGPDGLTSPSEPVFVQRRGATAENDGYLLSIWWDPAAGLSEILVHETTHFTRQPLARIKLPVRIPFSFHGSWANAEELDAAITAAARAD